jgi:WD40 repeat protein
MKPNARGIQGWWLGVACLWVLLLGPLSAQQPKLRDTLQGGPPPQALTPLSLAFSPDGKTLATVSNGVNVTLWDVASGKNTATLAGQPSIVLGVAFSPDGKTLASGSADTIKLWDILSAK